MKQVSAKDITRYFERSCLRKANLSEEKANRIIDDNIKYYDLVLYYYKCDFCCSHHLTSSEPTKYSHVEII